MTTPAHRIPPRERVIVALDVPDRARLDGLLARLDGRPAFYKIGLELFIAEGERAVEAVRARGGRIFLDLKLHDIPETVARAVASAARIEAELLTVHTSGGYEMLSRAAEAAAERVKILGVTVLTSLLEDDLRAEGIEATIPEMVRARARVAARAGIAGLVCSPHEIEAARGAAPGLFIVAPGIRPASGTGAAHGDQKRVATAAQAIGAGADYLVVGRPVRDAPDPAAAFEALVRARPRAVQVLYLAEGTRSPEIDRAVQAAKERGISVEVRPRRLVADLAGGGVHQGLVAVTGAYRYADPGELLDAAAGAGEAPLVVLLDGITDPHNLGAVVRSAEVLGAHGVIIPEHGAAPVTPAAVKASAGATERTRIARVTNLLRAIDSLRGRGVRVLGAGAGQGERLDRIDLRGPVGLVVGAEGKGMREAVARRCDGLFHIPQRGVVSSLNASVAAAVALYEAARQRM